MGKQRILIVEDMQKVRASLGKSMRAYYVVHTASDKGQALRKLASYSYSLVIIDEDLRGETHREGEDVIKYAKKLNSKRPVLAMSRENCEQGMLEAGADCFVFKKELLDHYNQRK